MPADTARFRVRGFQPWASVRLPALGLALWCFDPRIHGIDGVPAMPLVVPEPAMDDDSCTDAREPQAARGWNVGSRQRPAGVDQAQSPPPAVQAAQAAHASDDGYVRA